MFGRRRRYFAAAAAAAAAGTAFRFPSKLPVCVNERPTTKTANSWKRRTPNAKFDFVAVRWRWTRPSLPGQRLRPSTRFFRVPTTATPIFRLGIRYSSLHRPKCEHKFTAADVPLTSSNNEIGATDGDDLHVSDAVLPLLCQTPVLSQNRGYKREN